MEKSSIRIALAGNPNSGKTTLFNALTGSNQFVGNWPGVTVEKKEGKLKRDDSVIVTDLPGIYSLSPYTLEEVVARNYLVGERPDVILNIVDGTNIERNLYLTTQLTELAIPVVVAINMMDVVRKRGDKIQIDQLSRALGCPVIEISALKGDGIAEATDAAIAAARSGKTVPPSHSFSGPVEHALAHIEEAVLHEYPQEKQRWYAIKIFERDRQVLEELSIASQTLSHIEEDIVNTEKELDDDSESIITNERYLYIARLLEKCYKKKNAGKLSTSDKIDRVLTNRIAALPIFAAIMFLVYYISVSTVGTLVTDWTNDGIFGDGWHLFGIGSAEYEEAITDYAKENVWTDEFKLLVSVAAQRGVTGADEILSAVEAEDFAAFDEAYGTYAEGLIAENYDVGTIYDRAFGEDAEGVPATESFGIWVPGIPVLVGDGLAAINCAPWLQSLLLDGVVAGVGAVLGFVPQILVLFIMLAFLEACGYMSRIAFVLDRIFRKFGLSGKSFIPMLIGTGCGVPGIMASRTIENQSDRRMTIITTTFIPCGAKLPIIALIASAMFGGAWWVAPSAYFIGIAAIIVSGIILKKTKLFAGDPAPFVMELPEYHMPTFINVMRSMWERGWSFIKKAGTVILLSTIIIWAGSVFGITGESFGFYLDGPEVSVLDMIGGAISWIFIPLGFAAPETAVATLMGLVAKEEVVAVLGVLDFAGMTQLSAYSFMIFNLLCAPCFAAMGAIRREMNSAKWTAFAIAYQCLFAYAISLIVYQLGSLISGGFVGGIQLLWLSIAVLLLAGILFMLFRPYKSSKGVSLKAEK
ncbi:MAG: ferrous iron transporter B [Ruminococcaceae bacterium]|nr:ferrous iron transporter B [Oscillospiraceae bacterium]